MSIFRKQAIPQRFTPPGPLILTMPKPVDEHERDDAIAALEQMNADLDSTRQNIARLQERERRTVLAIAARKAQLDVLEFEKIERVERAEREVEEAINDNLDAGFDTSASDALVAAEQLREEAERKEALA